MEVQERLTQALADQYSVQNEIDHGGMATVYQAQDLKHDRQVAIKVLRPELAAGLGAERFVREIEISAKLAHPHILPLFDSGEAAGLLYYVMPYVEGESLQDRIEREGELQVEDTIRLTEQVASALTYAHEQGVVHRDIKPANILLTGDQAVVADFGIARALEAASTEGLTFTGLAVGTPSYMSPEQAMGGEEVDARTDVYSLGCVVYEMVTGGAPFEGTDPQAFAARLKAGRGPSLRTTDPSIPVFLDRAVSKALATDPGERFDTASEFAEALTTGTVVAQVRAPGKGRRWGLVGVAAAAVVLAGWWITQMMGAPRIQRLAVLPLTDLSDNLEQEYLTAGVHEALITELGQLGLSTISRATMAQYRDTEKGIGEIATELGVDGVVRGSVYLQGDSLEIATQLFAPDERELWAGSFDGVLPNVVALYRGFARAIADQVRLSLSHGSEARLENVAPSVNPAVYEAYLRGMHVLHNASTPEDFNTAIAHFNQAVEQNPTDPLAYAGLGLCYSTIGHGLAPPPGVWDLGQAAAERAIRLDSTLAEGWQVLASSKALSERDWEGSEYAFRRAHELNPSLAENHYLFAWVLGLFGNVEESLVEHTRAKELDPLIPLYTTVLPALHWFSEDYERALAEAREVAENQYPQDPFAHWVVGESAARLGRFDEAIAAHETMITLFPPLVTHLAHTYARAGRTEDALRIVEELEAQPPSTWNAQGLALIHAALGNEERAMDWLEFEPAHAWLAWITTSWFPDFRDYRDIPRFQALLQRMNLRMEPGDRFPTPLPMDRTDDSG